MLIINYIRLYSINSKKKKKKKKKKETRITSCKLKMRDSKVVGL